MLTGKYPLWFGYVTNTDRVNLTEWARYVNLTEWALYINLTEWAMYVNLTEWAM